MHCFLDSNGHLAYAFFFFFNDTATTEIYTLSLHDALPICSLALGGGLGALAVLTKNEVDSAPRPDRKSTRLNSSHQIISYAVFCLKKKKKRKRANSVKDMQSRDGDNLNDTHYVT